MSLDVLFAGMAQQEVNVRGEFFTQGLYTCEVLSLKYQNGFKGQSFIAKFKVLKSNNDTPVGLTRSWIVKLDKPKTKAAALGDIKQLFFALMGTDPKTVKGPEVDPKAHEQATALFKCAIDEPYAADYVAKKAKELEVDEADVKEMINFIGKVVELEATTVKTNPTPERPQGGEFTRHAWSPAA